MNTKNICKRIKINNLPQDSRLNVDVDLIFVSIYGMVEGAITTGKDFRNAEPALAYLNEAGIIIDLYSKEAIGFREDIEFLNDINYLHMSTTGRKKVIQQFSKDMEEGQKKDYLFKKGVTVGNRESSI